VGITAKQQKIYESVDDFFVRAFELRNSGKIERYFQFLKKVPDHAPFNNTLVFIQNPDCGYYATASQWEKRFGRSIKKDARPMVILFPFGPVEFVYDVRDTEGEQLTDEDIIHWWRENGGTLDGKIIDNTRRNLEKLGVRHEQIEARKYFEGESFQTGGYAQRNFSDELSIALHPRYSEASVESYGVLCHEIAHILLGHLGHVTLPPKKDNEKGREVAKDRREVPKRIMELEAELVAWIVFNSLGIEKQSETYIASWLVTRQDIERIGMSEVLKVSGKIQKMGEHRDVF
jgi:hypothetical protein